jgi:hypothetical protein
VEKCVLAILVDGVGEVGEIAKNVTTTIDQLLDLMQAGEVEKNVPAESDV